MDYGDAHSRLSNAMAQVRLTFEAEVEAMPPTEAQTARQQFKRDMLGHHIAELRRASYHVQRVALSAQRANKTDGWGHA
jgi:hypothetical protein